MDPKLMFSSPKISSLSTPLPFFISNQPTHSSLSTTSLQKTQFLGTTLVLSQRVNNVDFVSLRKRLNLPFGPIRSVVKRRKELPFDNVIQKDKKLKFVLKVRKILVSQPNRVMSLRSLGRFRKELGLDKQKRVIALLKSFPAVFQIVEEGAFSLKFKFTPEAERLYFDELRVRNGMEDLVVTKLRKLLMMSMEKRILLAKIAHLMTDFGLPQEFRDTICHRYPQYFQVVATEQGPALELTHWDPELAVSAAELAAEENRIREIEERNLIIDRVPKFNRVKLPKGLHLSKGETRKIMQFTDIPYISPYSDFSALRPGTREKEKHACGVVHEILSLSLEKRMLINHFTHFREEFRFSQQIRGMFIRHPDMFYVSLKGERDSVFLREAYRDSQLVDKDRLLLIKEKLRALVNVPRFSKGPSRTRVGDGMEDNDRREDEVDAEGEEEEEWSDTDNFIDGGFDDDDDDDWSDEDDDTPPYFDEDVATLEIGRRKLPKQGEETTKNDEKDRVPVFADDRPREQW
ncbi:unnamed protein product [Lupinus luteus]|uniref:PORR domain-containing protein n=1 Tax=Lupinus luteus TaxID=3873 RepID=A0AAV1WQD6_LUPLU